MKKSEVKKIIWTIAILIAIILVSAIFINKIKTANAIREAEEQKVLEDKLQEDCSCMERGKWKCQDGFELNAERKLCISEDGKRVTNVLLGCSEYSCSGDDYSFNSTTQKWEKQK